MKYFDLHCDTLCECYHKKRGLYGSGFHVDLDKAACFDTYLQCCAAWIPDSLRDEEAYRYFLRLRALIDEKLLCDTRKKLMKLNENGGIGLIPTIEGGTALAGSLNKIEYIAALGVKMLTLTWNGDNELGGGIGGSGSGLTDFGKAAVGLLEKNNIIIDISHASEQLFDDVCTYSAKPFVASHSCAGAICKHRRNLSDKQIMEIVRRGGLIGMNFFVDFLVDENKTASMKDIVRHVEHFLSLGAENVLCMGSDFDGAEIPADMDGIASIPTLCTMFSNLGYSDQLLHKLFYSNAYHFMLAELA